MSEIRPNLIPCIYCDECQNKCGMCNGTGLLRLNTIKLDDGSIEMYAPSNLSAEEVQAEFERSLDLLTNKFNISN